MHAPSHVSSPLLFIGNFIWFYSGGCGVLSFATKSAALWYFSFKSEGHWSNAQSQCSWIWVDNMNFLCLAESFVKKKNPTLKTNHQPTNQKSQNQPTNQPKKFCFLVPKLLAESYCTEVTLMSGCSNWKHWFTEQTGISIPWSLWCSVFCFTTCHVQYDLGFFPT